VSKLIPPFPQGHTRHDRSYAAAAGLSPVSGKTVVAKFDGGLLSSDGGILVLRESTTRRVADRLAACIEDPRSPDQITHSLADIIRFRLLMIAGRLRRRKRRQFSAKRSDV